MMKRRSLFCLVLSLSLLFLCAAASAGDYLALPDPGAYFGVAPNESGGSDSIWMTYAFQTEEECDRAFEEYAALLEDGPFDLKRVDDDSDWLYRFDYVGPLDVEKLDDRSWDGNEVLKLANFSNAGASVQITLSSGIIMVDSGIRPEVPFKVREPKNSVSSNDTVYEWDKPTCSVCSGSGRCPKCGGNGTVKKWVAGTFEYVDQNCTTCIGSGKCYQCGGSGRH